MMHKHVPVVAALAFLAACASSSQWKVDAYEAEAADMAGRHAFFYKPGEIVAPLVRQTSAVASAEASIRAAIVEGLQQRGYVQASDIAGADFVVTYQAMGTRRYVESDQRRIGAPSPNSVLMPGNTNPPPASELPPERSVRDITLVVFADDPATGSLVWRGLVSTELRTSSTDMLIRQVTDIARHITQQVPARRVTP